MLNVLVLTPYLYDTVPGQRFRMEQWARHLSQFGVRMEFESFESHALRRVIYAKGHSLRKGLELLRCVKRRVERLRQVRRQWDVIVLFRELLPIGPPLLERRLIRCGVPMVYDFDDAIFLPDVSDANRRFGWLKRPDKTGEICRLSRHVIVGNGYLEAYARRYTDRVSVIPTTIDTGIYTMKPRVALRDVPVIGWSGSLTTAKHLQTVIPALQTLRRIHPFRLKLIGASECHIPGLEVDSKMWNATSEIDDLHSFDIGIMPLPDDSWARGKCGLKALQYMAVGVPTVVSPVGVNAAIIQDGRNGFLASSEAEWVEKLSALLTDESLRARFAREGRRTIEERYSATIHVPRVLHILEQACS